MAKRKVIIISFLASTGNRRLKKKWEEEEMTHEYNKWNTLYPSPTTISFRSAGKNGMTQYSYT